MASRLRRRCRVPAEGYFPVRNSGGKAVDLALLAIGYALQGELDQACARGREAVDLAGSLDSARAITYIRRLLGELAPHDHEDQVRGFRTYAQAALPALQQRASRR